MKFVPILAALGIILIVVNGFGKSTNPRRNCTVDIAETYVSQDPEYQFPKSLINGLAQVLSSRGFHVVMKKRGDQVMRWTPADGDGYPSLRTVEFHVVLAAYRQEGKLQLDTGPSYKDFFDYFYIPRAKYEHSAIGASVELRQVELLPKLQYEYRPWDLPRAVAEWGGGVPSYRNDADGKIRSDHLLEVARQTFPTCGR